VTITMLAAAIAVLPRKLRMLLILSLVGPVDRRQSDAATVPGDETADSQGHCEAYRRPSKSRVQQIVRIRTLLSAHGQI
jgi:hypothetical protein